MGNFPGEAAALQIPRMKQKKIQLVALHLRLALLSR
jgi:hypothetical protein